MCCPSGIEPGVFWFQSGNMLLLSRDENSLMQMSIILNERILVVIKIVTLLGEGRKRKFDVTSWDHVECSAREKEKASFVSSYSIDEICILESRTFFKKIFYHKLFRHFWVVYFF